MNEQALRLERFRVILPERSARTPRPARVWFGDLIGDTHGDRHMGIKPVSEQTLAFGGEVEACARVDLADLKTQLLRKDRTKAHPECGLTGSRHQMAADLAAHAAVRSPDVEDSAIAEPKRVQSKAGGLQGVTQDIRMVKQHHVDACPFGNHVQVGAHRAKGLSRIIDGHGQISHTMHMGEKRPYANPLSFGAVMVKAARMGETRPSGQQIAAARGALGLSVRHLSELTGLGVNTIRRSEADGTGPMTSANARQLVATLASLGITFLEPTDDGPGIRFRGDTQVALSESAGESGVS